MKKMKLNIQYFAEEMSVESEVPIQNEVKTPTFTELLQNPEYQREFDRLVDKSLNTARTKWESDYRAKIDAERTEAEKLAKMDASQKMNYELKKAISEKENLQGQLNAMNLRKTAQDIAMNKGLPVGYLELLDFSKENAESIGTKIDALQQLRQRDMTALLNSRLRQPTPQTRQPETKKIDPYIEGFLAEF